eukprot:scaffold2602_cov177-Ochromonas_danica.AAC.21
MMTTPPAMSTYPHFDNTDCDLLECWSQISDLIPEIPSYPFTSYRFPAETLTAGTSFCFPSSELRPPHREDSWLCDGYARLGLSDVMSTKIIRCKSVDVSQSKSTSDKPNHESSRTVLSKA